MITDLNAREFTALAPLAALCLWLGVFAASLIELIERDVAAV